MHVFVGNSCDRSPPLSIKFAHCRKVPTVSLWIIPHAHLHPGWSHACMHACVRIQLVPRCASVEEYSEYVDVSMRPWQIQSGDQICCAHVYTCIASYYSCILQSMLIDVSCSTRVHNKFASVPQLDLVACMHWCMYCVHWLQFVEFPLNFQLH